MVFEKSSVTLIIIPKNRNRGVLQLLKRILFFSLLLTFSTLFTVTVSNASELEPSDTIGKEVIVNSETNLTESITEADISPLFVNDFRYRKKNVKYSEAWSGYKSISDVLNTSNSSGGSITASKSVSFKVDVSGAIHGLGLTTTGSMSSTKNYTLNVAKNKRVYLGYRVKYKIETGTREQYDITNGKVRTSNKYTIKTPIQGEHKLLNAK